MMASILRAVAFLAVAANAELVDSSNPHDLFHNHREEYFNFEFSNFFSTNVLNQSPHRIESHFKTDFVHDMIPKFTNRHVMNVDDIRSIQLKSAPDIQFVQTIDMPMIFLFCDFPNHLRFIFLFEMISNFL